MAHHSFSAETIGLVLELILSCAVSQRAAAAVLEHLAPRLPGLERAPCANTGRLWLLRLGLYELTRPKASDAGWFWIIDQTVQLGSRKALVIVGVRIDVWKAAPRPLRHEDLTLLALAPLEHSTGEAVQAQLEETAHKVGAPQAILSDGGGELQKGLKGFRAKHPQAALVRDITHQMALLLKHRLEGDARWAAFVKAAQRTKLRVLLTELAFLNPPSLKVKARYMNLGPLVTWGRRALAYLEEPTPIPEHAVDARRLQAKLGWLRDYRQALEEWSQWLEVAAASEDYVRHQGYHARAAREVAARLHAVASCPTSRALAVAAVRFVREQSLAARRGERLPGSSEVLESLFGKYKRLQGAHSQGGMTAMLLALGAIVSAKTPAVIRQAMETVKTDQIIDWCRKHLGPTIQGQRKIAFARHKNRTKNSNPSE